MVARRQGHHRLGGHAVHRPVGARRAPALLRHSGSPAAQGFHLLGRLHAHAAGMLSTKSSAFVVASSLLISISLSSHAGKPQPCMHQATACSAPCTATACSRPGTSRVLTLLYGMQDTDFQFSVKQWVIAAGAIVLVINLNAHYPGVIRWVPLQMQTG